MRKLLVAFLCLCPIVASAEEYILTPWEDGYSDTYFSRSHKPEWNQAYAMISYSTNGGNKMVVFTLIPTDENETCRLSYNDRGSDIIFSINGQAIKGGVRCTEYTDSKGRYYAFWPYTPEGTDYITRALKNSPSKVLISSPLTDFYLSAVGFTREWNSSGKDAL